MTGDEERGLLEWLAADAFWTATQYISPHEYILEKDHPELCARMKAYIQAAGYASRFLGRTYRYADLGEHRYWIVEEVLNRARLDVGGVERP